MEDVKVGALSVHKARKLMDKNFLGIERAKLRFGKDVFAENEKELSEMVFSKNFLERYKSTHILAAVPSLSINDIRDKFSKLDIQNKVRSSRLSCLIPIMNISDIIMGGNLRNVAAQQAGGLSEKANCRILSPKPGKNKKRCFLSVSMFQTLG